MIQRDENNTNRTHSIGRSLKIYWSRESQIQHDWGGGGEVNKCGEGFSVVEVEVGEDVRLSCTATVFRWESLGLFCFCF